MEGDLATVLDIVLASRRIQRFVAGTDETSFHAAEEKRWAVVSQLSIIGEAVRRLSDEFRDARQHIPWRQIAGMRDRLIHGYDKINWSLGGIQLPVICHGYWPSLRRWCRRSHSSFELRL
jgi:uncharacterized protein with HEPN domain